MRSTLSRSVAGPAFFQLDARGGDLGVAQNDRVVAVLMLAMLGLEGRPRSDLSGRPVQVKSTDPRNGQHGCHQSGPRRCAHFVLVRRGVIGAPVSHSIVATAVWYAIRASCSRRTA